MFATVIGYQIVPIPDKAHLPLRRLGGEGGRETSGCFLESHSAAQTVFHYSVQPGLASGKKVGGVSYRADIRGVGFYGRKRTTEHDRARHSNFSILVAGYSSTPPAPRPFSWHSL